jgi:hypothetical protein
MSDENSAAAVAMQHDPNSVLVRENEDLRKALAALQQNVVDGGFRGEVPRYLLNEAGFYDDTHFPAGSVIDFTDPPNLTMVPQNDAARRALQREIDRQTEGAMEVAALRGRRFFGLTTDRNVLIDDARELAKIQTNQVPVPEIRMPTPNGQIPAMPHLPEAQAAARRGPGRPRKAMAVAQPAQQGPESNRPMAAPRPMETGDLPPAIVGRRVA